jgi:hypothetical protein
MVDCREGNNLSRIYTFRPSGEAEPAYPADETGMNGTSCDADKAIQSGAENAVTPVDAPDARVAEEIRRRQLWLALRYVAAVRAR